jgi:uncharacterized membrane protein
MPFTLLIIDVRIPVSSAIGTSAGLRVALEHLLPSVFAFVLSFGVIFISRVNHHEAMRLVEKSLHPLIYANGFLMLGVVFVPFPAAPLGENLLTRCRLPSPWSSPSCGSIG